MEEAREAGFNQEGAPSLLGDAYAWLPVRRVCACVKGGLSACLTGFKTSHVLSDRVRCCMDLHFCIHACGCKKQRGLVQTRGGDLLFQSWKAGRMLQTKMTGGTLMSAQQHVLDVRQRAEKHIQYLFSPLCEGKAKANEANQAQNTNARPSLHLWSQRNG